uniref:4Fe-4S ferredoxin-type domain-containing protein n=1 Tax=Podarcis muralis TaxID=64176 RepID=A0A670HLA1_PODMU
GSHGPRPMSPWGPSPPSAAGRRKRSKLTPPATAGQQCPPPWLLPPWTKQRQPQQLISPNPQGGLPPAPPPTPPPAPPLPQAGLQPVPEAAAGAMGEHHTLLGLHHQADLHTPSLAPHEQTSQQPSPPTETAQQDRLPGLQVPRAAQLARPHQATPEGRGRSAGNALSQGPQPQRQGLAGQPRSAQRRGTSVGRRPAADLHQALAKGLGKGRGRPCVEYPVCLLCGRCTPYCPHPPTRYSPSLVVYPRLSVREGEVHMGLGFLLKIKRSEANEWGLVCKPDASRTRPGKEGLPSKLDRSKGQAAEEQGSHPPASGAREGCPRAQAAVGREAGPEAEKPRPERPETHPATENEARAGTPNAGPQHGACRAPQEAPQHPEAAASLHQERLGEGARQTCQAPQETGLPACPAQVPGEAVVPFVLSRRLQAPKPRGDLAPQAGLSAHKYKCLGAQP